MSWQGAMNWTAGTKPRKYRNVPTEYDGRMYSSKAEAAHAAQLDLEKRSGQIRGWLPQVSLPIPGKKRRMVIDFLVVMPDGRIRLQDVKGMKATREWQYKREDIEKALGLPIDVITRTRR
jgi:Protein of unknown function (DUF1064)